MTERSGLSEAEDRLVEFLARQRWFAGTPESVAVVAEEELVAGRPGLLRVEVEAAGQTWQLLVGLREPDDHPDFLRGRDDLIIGEIVVAGDKVLAYEAVADADLALALLALATGGEEQAQMVRPVGVEQSNSSLIFDDRLIFKIYRRLHVGPSIDAEMMWGLADCGFNHVPDPIAVWTRGDGTHLGFVQQFLAGGSDGWQLALTSLRDFYAADVDPGEAGGDFASEAHRIGVMTARMHVASANAFGLVDADPAAWAASMRRDQERFAGEPWVESAAGAADRLAELDDAGRAVRVHGDYHLGQVIRTDVGWFVLDFEGEPSRPPDDRRRPASPLKDVAGMLRSFHYAAHVALADREVEERVNLEPRGDEWEERNRDAFLDGYMSVTDVHDLLPSDPRALRAAIAAFEVEKAVYEVGYERDHRPDWEAIPRAAITRAADTDGDAGGAGAGAG